MAGVLFSNVLVVSAQAQPQREGQSLSIDYPLLFQNEGQEGAKLGLASASVLLNGAPARAVARCSEHGRAQGAAAELPPGRRLRVDCLLSLTAAGITEARRSDSELVLSLPVLSAGQVLMPEFSFRLRREDAS